MNNTVQTVNPTDIIGFIEANGTACRFASIVTRTPVVKIKAGNPYHTVSKGKVVGDCRLFKASQKLGLINANYNTSVRRRIADKLKVELSEVEYENGEVWFEHLKTSEGKRLPIVQNKVPERRNGEFYLQFFTHKATNCFVNDKGETVSDQTVKPWLYKESERDEWKPVTIAVNLKNVFQFKSSGVIVEMPELEELESLFAQ